MKQSLKHIGFLLLVFALGLGLVACQGKGEDNGAKNETNAAATENKESAAFEEATTEDVEKALKDENSIVVDARSNDSYIGWALDGDKRGGHIDGATDFSSYWIDGAYDEKENLEGDSRETVLAYTMENKKLEPGKKVIVYDTNGKDAEVVANYFKEKGIEDITIYNAK